MNITDFPPAVLATVFEATDRAVSRRTDLDKPTAIAVLAEFGRQVGKLDRGARLLPQLTPLNMIDRREDPEMAGIISEFADGADNLCSLLGTLGNVMQIVECGGGQPLATLRDARCYQELKEAHQRVRAFVETSGRDLK